MSTYRASDAVSEKRDVLAEADPTVHAAAKAAIQLSELWRRNASDVDAKLSGFIDLERDLAELIAHTEHLGGELERARPSTPVHKNAQEASRRAINRMYKILSAQETGLQQLGSLVAGITEKQSQRVADFQGSIARAKDYVASYKASAKAYDEEDEKPRKEDKTAITVEEPRSARDKAEKKEKKEKKARSKSPEKDRRHRGELRYV